MDCRNDLFRPRFEILRLRGYSADAFPLRADEGRAYGMSDLRVQTWRFECVPSVWYGAR